jgi:hypothetical protein
MTQFCSLEEAYPTPMSSKKKLAFFSKKDEAEHFETSVDTTKSLQNASSRKTYGSQTSDYDYMCKTAGLCIGEKFKNESDIQKQHQQPNEEESAKNIKKCARLEAPKYEYPFSENDKIRFKKALKIALEEMETSEPFSHARSHAPSPSTAPAPAPAQYIPRAYQEPTHADALSIDGYIDKELESYMMINDMKQAIPFKDDGKGPNTPKELVGFEKESSLGAPFPKKNQSSPSPVPSPSQYELSKTTERESIHIPENFTKKYKIIFDLLLFTVSGILIILILEQLFKMALLSGMNKTIIALEKIIDAKSLNVKDAPN